MVKNNSETLSLINMKVKFKIFIIFQVGNAFPKSGPSKSN